jgi:hypothetical protein
LNEAKNLNDICEVLYIITKLAALCDKTINVHVFCSKANDSRVKSFFEHNSLAVSLICNNSCNSQCFICKKAKQVFFSQQNESAEKY